MGGGPKNVKKSLEEIDEEEKEERRRRTTVPICKSRKEREIEGTMNERTPIPPMGSRGQISRKTGAALKYNVRESNLNVVWKVGWVRLSDLEHFGLIIGENEAREI